MPSYNVTDESLDKRIQNNPSVRFTIEINEEEALH